MSLDSAPPVGLPDIRALEAVLSDAIDEATIRILRVQNRLWDRPRSRRLLRRVARLEDRQRFLAGALLRVQLFVANYEAGRRTTA